MASQLWVDIELVLTVCKSAKGVEPIRENYPSKKEKEMWCVTLSGTAFAKNNPE